MSPSNPNPPPPPPLPSLPFPFNPYEEWSPEQIEIWHEKVRVEPTVMRVYDGLTPTIIYGPRGSGITTTLRLIRKYEEERNNFVVDWMPQEEVFPGLAQSVVRTSATKIIKRSRERGGTTLASVLLNEGVLDIWFWLLTTYFYGGDTRASTRWFQQHLRLQNYEPPETFATDQQPLHPVQVLDRLSQVIHVLGYEEMVFVTDDVTEVAIVFVQAWYRASMVHDNWGVSAITGLNKQFIEPFYSNARIKRFQLSWEWEVLWQICERMVTTALKLETVIEVPAHVKADLAAVVTSELGQTPQGAKLLAMTLYWLYQRIGGIPADSDAIKRDLYERSIHLSYDSEKKIIYRGIAPLKGLKEPQLQVFEYLYERLNQIVMHEELCKKFEIKKPHLDQIIKRIRQVIEPQFQEKKQRRWVYLLNEHSWGYVLRVGE